MSCQSSWPSWDIDELPEYDISMGWSGTQNCQTTVSGIEEADIWVMIWIVEQVFGEEEVDCLLITGGSEQWCHGGNGTISQHYCSRAIDIWTGGWSNEEEEDVRDLMDVYGYDAVGRGTPGHSNHVHMGWGDECEVEPPE